MTKVLSLFHGTLSRVSCCSFFVSSGNRRDLHSFPTRRSSDLRPGRPIRPDGMARPAPTTTRRLGRPRRRLLPRSEEHTSELQSRGHLVCRLLLEKKKTTTRCDCRPISRLPALTSGNPCIPPRP